MRQLLNLYLCITFVKQFTFIYKVLHSECSNNSECSITKFKLFLIYYKLITYFKLFEK